MLSLKKRTSYLHFVTAAKSCHKQYICEYKYPITLYSKVMGCDIYSMTERSVCYALYKTQKCHCFGEKRIARISWLGVTIRLFVVTTYNTFWIFFFFHFCRSCYHFLQLGHTHAKIMKMQIFWLQKLMKQSLSFFSSALAQSRKYIYLLSNKKHDRK